MNFSKNLFLLALSSAALSTTAYGMYGKSDSVLEMTATYDSEQLEKYAELKKIIISSKKNLRKENPILDNKAHVVKIESTTPKGRSPIKIFTSFPYPEPENK